MRLRLPACSPLAGAVLALAALAWEVPPTPALAQIESREGIALQNQILELQQQIEALRNNAGGTAGGGSMLGAARPTPLTGPQAGGGLDAQLLDRVQRLEEAVRELRGRIDDADNTRQRQYDELNKKIDDLAFRLGVTGGAGAAAPAAGGAAAAALAPATPSKPEAPAVPEAPAKPPPAPSATKRTAEQILRDGNAALARRDYAAAEAAAKEVLANGKGPRATDAQFLLAQALAGRKDWSRAAIAFDDAYNRNRTGAHAQDSLLGLANALTAINEKRAACETLDKLRAEFPTPRADLREPIAQARRTAGCR
jgi:TolA-binding protein